MAGWVRLAEWVEGGSVGVSARTVRRWIRDGINGEPAPAEAVRQIGGRWWVFPRLFESWLLRTDGREGVRFIDVERSAKVRAVWNKWRGRIPLD